MQRCSPLTSPEDLVPWKLLKGIEEKLLERIGEGDALQILV